MMRSSTHTLLALGLCLAVAACGTTKTPPPPAPKAEAPNGVLTAPGAIADAQRALNALGYAVGRADGKAGPRTDKAVRAYQKDEKLTADGRLTMLLAERLKSQRTKLPSARWTLAERGMTVIYGEGPAETLEATDKGALTWRTGDGARVVRPANFLLVSDAGVTTDAPANFLQPLRPGAEGQYQLHRGATTTTVSCTVGHLGRTVVPAGVFDAIETICREDSHPAVERHYVYAPELRLVIREEIRKEGEEGKIRELLALRPPTDAWPRAAQVGLDWALTHALEEPAEDEPVRWSSTGVSERYAIRADHATPIAIPSAAGGSGRCLRYDITRADGETHRHYPGIACKSEKGPWLIPAPTPTLIAQPSTGLSPQAER